MKNSTIIAGLTLGICIVVAACILSWNIRQLGADIRAAGVSAHTSLEPLRIPDTITLTNGNSFFGVQLRNYSGEPLLIEQQQKPK
jgi:hypothetical protein